MCQIELRSGCFECMSLDPNNRPKLSFADPPDCEGRKYDNYNDKMPDSEYIELLNKWIIKLCKITDGPVFFTFADRWTRSVEHCIKIYKIKLVQRLYWYYSFGQCNKKRYTPCIRPIYWLNEETIYPENIKIPSARQAKYGDKRAKEGGKLPDNMWQYSRVCGTFKERRSWHPTQIPEDLIKRIVLGHSKPGDLVLDPFVGSGTTAYVCNETNRSCLGIDQSRLYINKIKEEIKRRSKREQKCS